MLSFVVQNWNSNPFLYKTQKYNQLVLAMNTRLIWVFIKTNIYNNFNTKYNFNKCSILIFLFNKFFIKEFFKFFKKLYTTNFGLMTINITKSLIYKTLNDLNLFLKSPVKVKQFNTQNFSTFSIKYLQPVTLISFSFQKETYNSLMIYVLFLLTHVYIGSQNSFKLNYSFILHFSNLNLYPFLNNFYFKLRNF